MNAKNENPCDGNSGTKTGNGVEFPDERDRVNVGLTILSGGTQLICVWLKIHSGV